MKFKFVNKKGYEKALQQLAKVNDQIKQASVFINQMERGDLQAEVSGNLKESELGLALLSMKKHLSKISMEEQERSWLNVGLAKFSDLLRNKDSLDLKSLSDTILANLVRYVNANQGAIFILEKDAHAEEYLQMISCYAYERKQLLNKRIELGEGLAGQCALEKQVIHLTETPANYVQITSGLGSTTPRSILISPLLINENIFGVLELASLSEFQPYQINFINKLAENIASTIKNVKDNDRTRFLLNASQQQTEELRAQEEEMRQNMEELQATQEEMKRKSDELEMTMSEMNGVLNGINATMATIEFTPDGKIIAANSNFLKAMKYSLDEIKGKHHKMFVPKEILESDDYETFWDRLASGESMTGIFKRISSSGDTIWLNAIYNPIRNATGAVIKVVKFAIDITAQQEMLAESKGLLSGINATMATIEFTPDGKIISANSNFLNAMKYSIEEITGRHHKMFVPKETVESADYKTFWKRLASGESMKGTFKRIASTGDTVWLSAIYNPILNANGAVIKVVKFATDITVQQEMLAESKGLLNGINTTMATIEFTPEGKIIGANSNFLKAMKYSLEEIKGKHHKMFVSKETVESDDYKIFWKQLSRGESMTGIFQRISSTGNTVWLNAIYNPIRNANGEVMKVVKFATDITAEQERLILHNSSNESAKFG